MEKIEKGVTLLDKVLSIVEKYKIKTIFKGVFIILVIAGVIGFISNPMFAFEQFAIWQEKQHNEKIEIRMRNNEKLHILIEKLLYKVNADRVLILELHNGNTSNSGLPFAKCSATYEALNENIYPVSDMYQNINLSLMPFATELYTNGYWCGNTEELKDIDKALCYRMMGNDTAHFAGVLIKGVDKPLAFLFVKFKSIDENHNCEEIKKIINDNALQLSLLLELNKTAK